MFFQSSKVREILLNVLPFLFGPIGIYLIFIEENILLAFICAGVGSLFLFFQYQEVQEEKRNKEIWKFLDQKLREIEKLGEER